MSYLKLITPTNLATEKARFFSEPNYSPQLEYNWDPSISQLTYMQDMTHDICQNTQESYTKRLVDLRDGNYYWVAKLKDGNCWMTQNLDLNITTAGLTHTTSDIRESRNSWSSETTNPPSKHQFHPRYWRTFYFAQL